jgi:hypothetical protein
MFPDFLSCGSKKSREGGDRGIPPLRKRPRKDGSPRKFRDQWSTQLSRFRSRNFLRKPEVQGV